MEDVNTPSTTYNVTPDPSLPSILISDGAAIALGSALSRFLSYDQQKRSAKKGSTKRSRLIPKYSENNNKPIVLIENEEVNKELSELLEQKKKYKIQRQRKITFESNARVIPDAATGIVMEKLLLQTATKGSVALFNAVSKAQKTAADEVAKVARKKKQDKAVSKESFMKLMKAGINKNLAMAMPMNIDQKSHKMDDDDDVDEVEGKKEEHVAGQGGSAKWLRDDFLTSGSKKMNDWDKEDNEPVEESSEESENDDDEMADGDIDDDSDVADDSDDASED